MNDRTSIYGGLGLLMISCIGYVSSTENIFDVPTDVERVSYSAESGWTIVGAGPAAIAALGMLLDLGIPAPMIRWIDPEFNVGRLGKYYANVPGNGKTEAYIQFLNACECFKECDSCALRALRENDTQDRCVLLLVIDALKDLTEYLAQQVGARQTTVAKVHSVDGVWNVLLATGESFTTHNIVLATGSHPISLNYQVKEEIPLDIALDKKTLQTLIDPDDTIAVVGGSHSAMLILKYLHEFGVPRVMNFYKHPIVYDYDLGEGNATGFNGLKGAVANWAYYTLEKQQPASIIRLRNTQEARDSWISFCNKIIYAIGYERNELSFLGSLEPCAESYDPNNGVIASRIFGIGIAFPEQRPSEEEKPQNLIGIIDFMKYAQRVVPIWVTMKNRGYFDKFDELFRICVM